MLSSPGESSRRDEEGEKKFRPSRPPYIGLRCCSWCSCSLVAMVSSKCCRADISPFGDTRSTRDLSTGEDLLREQEASSNPKLYEPQNPSLY